MNGKGSKVYAYQIAGVIMMLLVIAVVGWDLLHGEPGENPATGQVQPIPSTPSKLIQLHETKLPDLSEWLANWQSSHTTGGRTSESYTADADLDVLHDLLSKSDLSAIETLRLTRMLGISGDLPACETVARIAMVRTHAQLDKAVRDDQTVQPLLDAMGSAEDPLWRIKACGPLLEDITNLLMRFNRFQEDDQRLEWAHIGHSESLIMQNKYDDALAEAGTMINDAKTNTHWTDAQKAGAQWVASMALCAESRLVEAIPHLELASKTETFAHRRDATTALMGAYARTGRVKDAENCYEAYIKRFNPDPQMAARVRANMERRITQASTQP